MALRCPACGREFDVTLFEFNREVVCPCGERLSLKKGHEQPRDINWETLEKEIFGAVNARQRQIDRVKAQEIREMADKISSLILQKDIARIDIEIEIKNFRAFVLEHFPEKEELFKAIYINRFRRLWDQFRGDEGPLFGPGRRTK
jgi:DNA-directed RNA polymerase subunit RPC12/RpoP